MERKRNIEALKKLLKEKKETMNAYAGLSRFLMSKGISRALAEEILVEVALPPTHEPLCHLTALKEALAKKMSAAGELNFPKKLALVGPTGVGKTTMVVKLAAHYQKQGKKIGLFSLDEEKKEQLRFFAKRWDIQLYDQVEEADTDLLLIDTPGRNVYQPMCVDELGVELAQWPDIEVLLTLSASTKDVDLYGAIHQFSVLSPSSIAFTKLDETLANGVLVNVANKAPIPLRFVAYGYPLPGEIHLANPVEITHKILTDMNSEEFNYLRQLTL